MHVHVHARVKGHLEPHTVCLGGYNITNRILQLGGEARYSTSSTFSLLYPASKLGPPNVLAFRSFQIDLPTRKEQGVKTLLLLVALSYAEEA